MLLMAYRRFTLAADDRQVNPDVGIHNRPWEALAKPQVGDVPSTKPLRIIDSRAECNCHRCDRKPNCNR